MLVRIEAVLRGVPEGGCAERLKAEDGILRACPPRSTLLDSAAYMHNGHSMSCTFSRALQSTERLSTQMCLRSSLAGYTTYVYKRPFKTQAAFLHAECKNAAAATAVI